MLKPVKSGKYQNDTKRRENSSFCFQNVTNPLPLRFPSAFAPLSKILLCLYPVRCTMSIESGTQASHMFNFNLFQYV